ncbi:hypothetical protein AB1E18_007056 [Capra hircus]
MLKAQRSGARKKQGAELTMAVSGLAAARPGNSREDQGSFSGPFYTVGVPGGDSRFGELVTELIDGVAQIIFNTSEAIENLSYISLKELNNKYLSIFVEVQESTVTGSGCYFTFPETWDSIFHKGYCCCCCWLELMTQTFQKNIRPAMTIKQ